MMQVVALALIDDRGRVLMQRRAAGRQHAGLWEFPGGKLEPGETRELALLREIREELGLELNKASLAPLASAKDRTAGIVIWLYTCRQWQGEPTCLDADGLDWYTADTLELLAMPPLDVPLAKAVKQLLGEAN